MAKVFENLRITSQTLRNLIPCEVEGEDARGSLKSRNCRNAGAELRINNCADANQVWRAHAY
jgi:hypothetical protein